MPLQMSRNTAVAVNRHRIDGGIRVDPPRSVLIRVPFLPKRQATTLERRRAGVKG